MHLRTFLTTIAVVIIGGLVVFYPTQTKAAEGACPKGNNAGEMRCFTSVEAIDLKCFDGFLTCGTAEQRCCQIPALGESGEKCFNKAQIANNQALQSGLGFLKDSIADQSKCIIIFGNPVLCPAKIIADGMTSLDASVKKSLGLDTAGSAAYACKTGIPDPQYVDANGEINDFANCQCINPERNPANAVVKLCLQHVAQVPIEFARLEAKKNNGWDNIFSRTVLNNGDRYGLQNFLGLGSLIGKVTPDTGTWDNMLVKLGDGNLWDKRPAALKESARVKFGECVACALSGGYPSAIGCLPLDNVGKFIGETVFGIGLSIAGAICLLCIIYSAIMLQTSQGSSEQIEKARKTLIQCLSGLVFIIFAIFILRFIGVNLLRIYGLS